MITVLAPILLQMIMNDIFGIFNLCDRSCIMQCGFPMEIILKASPLDDPSERASISKVKFLDLNY